VVYLNEEKGEQRPDRERWIEKDSAHKLLLSFELDSLLSSICLKYKNKIKCSKRERERSIDFFAMKKYTKQELRLLFCLNIHSLLSTEFKFLSFNFSL